MKTSTSETFWHGQTGTIKGSWLIKGLLPEMGTALLSADNGACIRALRSSSSVPP
jgi:hypothetical protein